MQRAHDPLYEIDPQTGVSIEVFWTDHTLETFGRGGAGWFWWSRRRGVGPATGPFTSCYSISTRDELDGDQPLMHERLANRTSLSMCQACDMEQPTQDDT
jgi:hypothetical protein